MASKITSIGTTPKASRARRGKAFMARATARTPSSSIISISNSSSSSSNPQTVQLSTPGIKPPGWPLRLHPYGWSQWVRDRLKSGGYGNRTCWACGVYAEGCQLRVHPRAASRWRQWIPDAPRRCSTMFLRALGRKMPHQSFNQFPCSCRHPRRSSVFEIPAPFCTHVSRSCNLAGLAIRA